MVSCSSLETSSIQVYLSLMWSLYRDVSCHPRAVAQCPICIPHAFQENFIAAKPTLTSLAIREVNFHN